MAVKPNFIGLVVSQGKMNKTVKVRVNSNIYNQKIHKEVVKRNHYLVHDEGNVCKEGDIVRIEQIPKISARKYFAVAEIKVNKGQQFAQYEEAAKARIAAENREKLEEFTRKKQELAQVVTQIEDLRQLDAIAARVGSGSAADDEQLVQQIDAIKTKYNFTLWPTTEEVLPFAINEMNADLAEAHRRRANLDSILDKILADDSLVAQVLAKLGKLEPVKKHTQKNLVRKYVLDVKNELPVTI